ncbi:MAG: EAL domain-containing protein, partial [Nitrosomonas sp.]|nr:EAL domain-containing protein [Nitrosomonas sp.]
YYIRALSDEELIQRLQSGFIPADCPIDLLPALMPLVKSRLTTLRDFESLTDFFYRTPTSPEFSEEEQIYLSVAKEVLSACDWTKEGIETKLVESVKAKGWKNGPFFAALRLAITGKKVSPPLTESMIMSDFATAKSRLEQLREAGAQISIDDFGTGYSNLYQLSHLPFNVLKIDKSLVDDIGKNSKSEAIVTAIVQMAHSLGHRVVAEGVETHEQYAFLRKARCDQVQGYLFGRPMPAHALIEWVSDHASDNGSMDTLIEKISRVA